MSFEMAKKHFLDGLSLLDSERYEEAEFHFLESLSLMPDRISTLINLSATQIKIKKFSDAKNYLEQVIELDQNCAEAFLNLGIINREQEKFIPALEIFEVAIKLKPNYPEALSNKGIALHELKRYDEALLSYDKAISFKPDYYEAWSNRGVTLNELDYYNEALASYDKAISLQPSYYEAWANKGIALHELKRYDEALLSYDKAISFKPNYYEAWNNKGATFSELKRYEEALASYDKAISLKPDYYEAWANKGIALHELKRYDEALLSYDKAISFKPDLYDAYWGKALIQLTLGNFKDGLKNYEYRLERTSAYPKRHQEFPLLTNLNQPLGKRVLVWSEQGHGDTIQFSRLIKQLSDLNVTIIFEVQAGLKALLEYSIKHATVISEGTPFGQVDFQIPLMSLPLLLELDINDIPSDPYLEDSKEDSITWKKKLSVANNKLNIGIACSGNEQHINDKNRSIDLKLFKPIADKVNLFLIQKDLRKSDQDFLRTHPEIKFLGKEITSFNDSASIIQAMDLVITVDTSLAHLSGALGKPTLILLPWNSEWRWLLGRQDSPWYPTVKIFRQPHSGNWEAVIEDVALHLNLNHQR